MASNLKLPLHEQLMLLMLRDDTGTMESHTSMYQLALGGAILAELMLAGAVEIEDDKKKHVRVLREKSLRDAVLDEALAMVADSKRAHGASTWVSRFGGIRRLRHRIAEELCRKNILEDSEDKVLFFFTRAIYPTINPRPERQLVERMRDAVLGDRHDLDSDLVLLIALAHATGLLRIHFEKSELKGRKERVESIAAGHEVAKGTADAVEAAQEAVQAAVMTAIIASTVVNTTVIGH